MDIKNFKHLSNPEQTLFDEIQDCVDTATNAGRSSPQWTATAVFKSVFRPICLARTEYCSVIINPDRDRNRAVRFSSNVMIVPEFHPIFLALALVADNPFLLSDQSLRAGFATRTLPGCADSSLGYNLAPLPLGLRSGNPFAISCTPGVKRLE